MTDWLERLMRDAAQDPETEEGTQALVQALSPRVLPSSPVRATGSPVFSSSASSPALSLAENTRLDAGFSRNAEAWIDARAEAGLSAPSEAALSPSGSAEQLEQQLRPRWKQGSVGTPGSSAHAAWVVSSAAQAAQSLPEKLPFARSDQGAALDVAGLDRLLERDARRFDGGFSQLNGGDHLWN